MDRYRVKKDLMVCERHMKRNTYRKKVTEDTWTKTYTYINTTRARETFFLVWNILK